LGYGTPEEFAAANGCGKDGGFATLENATLFLLSPSHDDGGQFRPLQWNQKPWELRYEWTKNGGQSVIPGCRKKLKAPSINENNS